MILITQLTVADYDIWKAVFDEYQPARAAHTCVGHAVYRNTEQPDEVTVVFEYESRERAEALFREPSVAEGLKRGGTVGAPRVIWAERVEAVVYGASGEA